MKRITQILASILFIISVLTIYLAFDFAISNAVTHKNSSHKRIHHTRDHNHRQHEPEEIKVTRKRSLTLPILHYAKKLHNQTNKTHHNDGHDTQQRRSNNNLKSQQQQQNRAKPGNFHKGKTGVKVNKPRKLKEQKRRLSTSTTQSQKKDKRHFDDNKHV